MNRRSFDIRHRRSIRLRGYDYSREGYYFVTLCTHNRLHIFGKIVDGKMRLNDNGFIIKNCWNDIPSHFPNVVLREFIIMPNHIHGIIKIVKPHPSTKNVNCVIIQETGAMIEEKGAMIEEKGAINRARTCGVVGARFIAPNHPAPHSPAPYCPASDNVIAPHSPAPIHPATTGTVGGFSGTKNPMLRTDLARVIRWYKGRTTFECRQTHGISIWQRNYYERIIRDRRSYYYIAKYINANPVKWQKDRFYNKENTYEHK